MSVLNGRLTVRRLLLSDEIPIPATQPALHRLVLEGLLEHAFRPGGPGSEQSVGWVRADNPLDTDFDRDLNAWQIGPWFCFQLRVDAKTVPAKLLRAHVDKLTRAWCAERNMERAPPSVIQDLRDMKREELLRGVPAKMKITELAWNTATGLVLVGTHSDKTIDEIRKHFFRTFGFRLVVDDPRDAYPDAADAVSYALVPHFLLWLWWTTQVSGPTGVDTDEPVEIWLDDRMRLDSPTDKSQATLTGDNPGASEEARAALRVGKLPTEVRFGIIYDEAHLYSGTLKGELLDLAGVALPVVIDGGDEAFLDRMNAYEALHGVLTRLLAHWAALRTRVDWDTGTAREIRAWSAGVPAIDAPLDPARATQMGLGLGA